jgi:5'(3')-deoxyribonucleotidase
MRIGIDCDDTINNLVEVWLNRYNVDYNDNVSISDIKTWDIGDHTKAGKDFYKYLGDEKLFKSLSIKEGAAETIEKLCKQHEVYIVTANGSYNKGVCDDKVNFVKRFMPFFPIGNIIFINNKSLLDLDVLIDDGLHNFEGFKGIKIVFDRPWNRDSDLSLRLTGWDYEKLHNLIFYGEIWME